MADFKPNKKVTEHFTYNDFKCPCCDLLKLSGRFYLHVEKLEVIRQKYDKKLIINSGYRCSNHNKRVGGVADSQHLIFATDFRPLGIYTMEDLDLLANLAEEEGFAGIGRYNTFNHIDLRQQPAAWDNRTHKEA